MDKHKVNLICCDLINMYQQTIEPCKHFTPRLKLSCHVTKAVDPCNRKLDKATLPTGFHTFPLMLVWRI